MNPEIEKYARNVPLELSAECLDDGGMSGDDAVRGEGCRQAVDFGKAVGTREEVQLPFGVFAGIAKDPGDLLAACLVLPVQVDADAEGLAFHALHGEIIPKPSWICFA